ncbi:MAG: DUF2262 domain-containing protein [Ruminococcus sp.]|nr:DUF2262 domain-containing protein [Ruminococcus sp.]
MEREINAFEARFDPSIKEVLVLTRDNTGAGRFGQNQMWSASLSILAMVDTESDALIAGRRSLTWLMTDMQRRTDEKIFGLKAEKIYRLKVRESLPLIIEETGRTIERGASLLVCEVVERDCADERLEGILQKYQQPVTLHPEGCGTLLLHKHLGVFSGDGEWNGCVCTVYLDVDTEEAETADHALAVWNRLCADAAEWDEKARRYAAGLLTEDAKDWLMDNEEADEDEIEEFTEEEFAERITPGEICISNHGDFEIYYDDDDMFWGHVIIVHGTLDGDFTGAEIAG